MAFSWFVINLSMILLGVNEEIKYLFNDVFFCIKVIWLITDYNYLLVYCYYFSFYDINDIDVNAHPTVKFTEPL